MIRLHLIIKRVSESDAVFFPLTPALPGSNTFTINLFLNAFIFPSKEANVLSSKLALAGMLLESY